MMTLGNIRQNGVRALSVYFLRGHPDAILVDVDSYSDHVTVPSFGPRMVCTLCVAFDADARPNWNERAPPNLYNTNRL